MKNWKIVMLVVGILLLIAGFVAYIARIASCYPAATIFAQYSPDYVKAYRESCQMNAAVTTQFSLFMELFIPGILLFSAYWLTTRPKVKNRRSGQMLNIFLLLVLFDSLLVMFTGLLKYPAPGDANAPAGWVVESVAALGFLCYLGSLALWHWKRWGLLLFQGASIALAVFILLGGGSLILAAVIIGGVLVLSLLFRSLRSKRV